MKLLEGKHILITGASRGIGEAMAHLFASHGAILYLNSSKLEAVEVLAKKLMEEFGTQCHALAFDVGSSDEVKVGFQALFKLTKKLDVLVNNAGILDDALLGMVTTGQIQQTFSINTFSVIYCCQYASRLMQRAGGGSIINVSSIIGRVGNQGQTVYGGSKAAVIGITQSLAKELASQQIRVNAIAPGFIDTPMTKALSHEKYLERISSIAMGHIGQPEDVANAALFLASDMAKYITGQVIGVDGGMLI